MKRIFTILLILILHFSMYAQEVSFTREERKLIRKCKTARFSIVHGVRMKEFIQLMNLARKDGALLQKYIRAKYGDEYAEKPVFVREAKLHANNTWEVNRQLLRPSLGLHLGSWLHGKYGGFTGHLGHKFFLQRSLISLNFMVFAPGNTIGENCAYGHNNAIDNFTSLMESIAHRSNILNPSYYRVGVSKSFHLDYKRSCVLMFRQTLNLPLHPLLLIYKDKQSNFFFFRPYHCTDISFAKFSLVCGLVRLGYVYDCVGLVY